MAKEPGKLQDDDSFKPHVVKDDPYKELFAACSTAQEVWDLQAEIDAAEASGQ